MQGTTIAGLLKARDDMTGELMALRERAAAVYNDVEALERVVARLGL